MKINLNKVQTILVLEDNLERIKAFRELFIGKTVTYTDQAHVAIEMVQKTKWDIIFLDHDLGGEIFVDSEKQNTGYQVAKVLPESMNAETPCIVHSMNWMGANRMCEVSPGNTHKVPFHKLLPILKDIARVA